MRMRSVGLVAAVAAAALTMTMGGLGAATAQPTGSSGNGSSAGPQPTSADPIMRSGHLLATPAAPDGSAITGYTIHDGQTLTLTVHAAAMNRDVRVDVQRPADPSKPRPTLYLLNGAGGGQDSATWTQNTDALKTLATKNVNVVQVIGGAWTYYTDWRAKDKELGVNKWKTFLTKELPPIINGSMGTNGVNAIAGLSTSGTTVLALPEAAPGLYRAAAAYSGCAQVSDPVGYRFINMTVDIWGGGDIRNMYGPYGDPMWAANDPYVHADRLRGLDLFISSGSGLPGPYDTFNGPHALPGATGLADQLLLGGVIEAGVSYCTHNLQRKLDALGIPATYDFTPTGTHSWGYWEEAFKKSWPVLAHGLGLPA